MTPVHPQLSSKIGLLYFAPSDQLTLHPLHLPPSRLCVPPFIQTRTVVAELHIERICGLTSWGCESHFNRCSSWADTQASPCESMLLLRQERWESGSWQWCDELCFLIFHSPDLFPPFAALLPISTPLYLHPEPSITPSSGFPPHSIPWSGRPIAVVMREVNWLCCVFRRLDNDDGSGRIEGDNFLWIPTCLPSAVFI